MARKSNAELYEEYRNKGANQTGGVSTDASTTRKSNLDLYLERKAPSIFSDFSTMYKSYFDTANSLVDSHRSRYYDEEGNFVGGSWRSDYADYYENTRQSTLSLHEQRQKLLDMLDNYGEYFNFGDTSIDDVRASIENVYTDSRDIFKSSSDEYDHWSQWKNEDEYKAWLEAYNAASEKQEEYKKHASSDQASVGRQKYLEDEKKGTSEGETLKWYEKMMMYLGGVQDTTLPGVAETNAVITAKMLDDSYRKPNADWTEEQWNTFGSLYMNSKDEAFKYAEETNIINNRAKEEEALKKIAESATSGFWAGAGHTAGAIAAAPFGLADFLDDVTTSIAGRPIAPDGHVSPFEYSQAVTGGISEHLNEEGGTLNENIPIIGGKGWGDVYGLGTSIAQSMTSAYTLGGAGTLISYFGQGAAAGVDEALERGASDGQAVLYGTALGVFEGLAEQIGIDNLFKLGSSTTVKGFIKNILKQAGAEGAEEGLTALLSNIADNAIMQDKSNFNLSVEKYMAAGMSESEAKKKAWMDSIEGIAFDTIAGAVSGGVSGSVHTSVANIIANKEAKQVYGDGAGVVAEAKELGGDAGVLAEQYQKKLDKGKSLSGGQINRLVEASEPIIKEQDTSKISDAVEARLTKLGETGDVSAITSAIVKQVIGEELTSSERSLLKNSKYGQRVSNEVSPENIESGEYSSGWAESIGTKRINAKAYNKTAIDAFKKTVDEANKMAAEAKSEAVSTKVAEMVEKSGLVTSDDGETINTKTGEAVAIKEIASIKDGEITLRTVDGETISAKDVSFSDNEAILYSAVADMGVSAAVANSIIDNYVPSSNVSAEQYALGVQEAYKYGRYGFHTSEMSFDGFSADLSEAQRTHAYNLGASDAKHLVNAAQKAVDARKAKGEKTTKKGKVQFEGDITDVDISKLPDLQKASIKAIEKISEALGVDIYIYKSEVKDGKRVFTNSEGNEVAAPNGYYDPSDGSIHIDLFAGNNGEGVMLFTAAHELTHFVKHWSPQKFKVLADFLMEQYGKKGVSVDELVKAKIPAIQKRKPTLSYNQLYDLAYEEVVADSMEKMLADGKVMEKLALLKQKDKGLVAKIKSFLDDLVAKIKAAYKGLDPDSREGKLVGEMKDSIEKLQSLFTDALVEASDNYQSLMTMEENTDVVPVEGVVMHSYRSLAEASGFEAVEDETGRFFMRNGVKVSEVTVEDIENSPIGAFINYSLEKNDISLEEANRQKKMFADIGTLACKTNDFSMAMQFVGSAVFTGMKANADKQYGTTYDFPSICTKTQAVIDAMSARMVKLGRGLSSDELVKLYQDVFASGNPVPCPECYVFSRWIGIGGLLDNIKKYQDYYGDMDVEDVAKAYRDMRDKVAAFAYEQGISFGKAKGALTSKLTKEYNKLKEKIEKAQNQGEKVKPADQKKLDELEPMMNTVKGMTWLENVYFADSSLKKVNPRFRVPNDVLFDLNNGEAFATKYKEAWAFRTTQGAGYGKAITPYAEARLGEGVLVTNNTTNAIKGKAQGSLDNFFLRQNGTLDKKARDALNRARLKQLIQAFIGGQRFQSTSDARYENASDYLLAALEMQAMRGMVQVYTKVDGAVPAFSAWGFSINQSLMPLGSGLDAKGNLKDTSVGGMNRDIAFENRKKYETAGTITIGVNDAHIRELFKQLVRDFIIPYHASGGKADLVAAFRSIQEGQAKRGKMVRSTDYSRTQSDKVLSDEVLRWKGKTEEEINRIHEVRAARIAILTKGKVDMDVVRSNRFLSALYDKLNGGEWDGVKLAKSKVESQIYPNEFWDQSVSYEESGKITRDYLEYCEDLGFLHRFSGTVPSNGRLVPVNGYDQNGNRVQLTDLAYKYENGQKTDQVEEFFWKVLTDRRMYDNDGKYLPQKIVTLNDTTEDTVTSFAKGNYGRQYDKEVSKNTAAKIADKKYSERGYAPTFYSQMGKVVEGVKQEKLAANSVVNMLRGKGVKAEEIRWSGIVPFLEGKKSVTKQELLEFINGSMLQIDQKVLDDSDSLNTEVKRNGFKTLEAYINGKLVATYKKSKDGLYESDNAREYPAVLNKKELKEHLDYKASRLHKSRFGQYKLDGGENYREVLFELPNSDYTNEAMTVHWRRKGILAHARVQDFDVDGKKMLFVEEIQSDWHNEGHKEGYQTSVDDSTGVPDAPFKDTYHEFVLKNLIREAAEKGYDSIGWTPAEVQSKRWSDEYAEGYRIEYDQDIPKFLKKYGKQWGATVGSTTLPNGTEVWSMDITDSMKDSVLHEGQVMYSERVTDKETLDFLNEQVERGEYITVYRSFQVRDGGLYAPMNSVDRDEDGKNKRLGYRSELGEWEKSTESREIAKRYMDAHPDAPYAKFDLDGGDNKTNGVAYNPYLHSSNLVLNDQFAAAYRRNLVTVECIVPLSEADGAYKADYAKDGTGWAKWKAGGVAKDLKKIKPELERKLFLSRYMLPVRILSDSEVATMYKGYLDGTNISIPWNVVTPSLRKELEKVGVGISYKDVNQGSGILKFADKFPEEASKIIFSERSSEDISHRGLLANALESAATTGEEKNLLRNYKTNIRLIEAEQKKLSSIMDKLFAKGSKIEPAERKKLQSEMKQTSSRINTYDRQLLKLEAMQPLQKVLAREKEMAKKRQKQKDMQLLADYKEKSKATVREILVKNQESRKKAIEGRNMTQMRHKIKSVVNDLNQLLLKGTKDKHVMIGLQKAVASALDAVNMDTVGADERIAKYDDLIAKAKDPDVIESLTATRNRIAEQGDKMSDKLAALKSSYAEIKNSSDPLIANSHDEVIENKIQSVVDSVGNTPLRNMTLKQLEDVYDLYKMVLTTIQNSNKAFKMDKSKSIAILGNNIMGEVHSVAGEKEYTAKALEGLKKFGWSSLKPTQAFELIGSGTFKKLFANVRAGEDVWAVDVNEAREYYREKTSKYGYDSWDFDQRFEFNSKMGKKFSLSLEQIMSLYAYSKRKQADLHLEQGGFVFDEAIEVSEKKLGFIPVKYKVNTAKAYSISKEELGNIIGTLSDRQRFFVDEMQAYLSDVMGAKGNEVSLEMYGVKLFKEQFYFPLKSAKQFMFEQNEVAGEVRIKNSGFSKETVAKANNPIILSNFMDVWANHVNDMSMYHAFVLPLEDFNRVFNYKTPTSDKYNPESVKSYLQNAYGTQPVDYIKQLITDLNGGARVDASAGFVNKGISLFKKGAVFASASVVIQQPSAIARAFAYIDPKYFVTAKNDLTKHSRDWEECKQYAPVAMIKEMGYFDTNVGPQTTEWITSKEYKGFKEKVKGVFKDSNYRDELLSKAPALADELAWTHIWNAVKKEIASTTNLKVGSEEFLKRAGERFTEVVVNTQVYDSVLSRSGLMRSKDTGVKMATAFMAEPTTSLNMIANAVVQAKRGNKKLARNIVGGVASSIILNSILVSLVYAARDDDEDETYAEKYLGSLTSELIDGFNPITYIPFFKDIWSIAQGYDVERSDMSIFSKLWQSVEELFDENKSALDKVLDFSGSVANLFGLPMKNITRDVMAVYNTVTNDLGLFDTTIAGVGDSVADALRNSVPLLGRFYKEDTKAQKLYDAILGGDATEIERAKSQFKDDEAIDTAVKKALRENDPRIKEAAKARISGDISKYKSIVTSITSEGHFSQDLVVKAINAEINLINKEADDANESSGDEDEEAKATSIYKASDINVALENGNTADALAVIDDLVRVKTENYIAEGEKKKDAEKKAKASVRSSVTSYWKELYLEAYQSKDNAEMTRIRKILKSTDLYDNVVENCQDWVKQSKKSK